MEDPGITRLDIDRYRRSLKLNLSDAARQETLALLAEAEARLQTRGQDNSRKGLNGGHEQPPTGDAAVP